MAISVRDNCVIENRSNHHVCNQVPKFAIVVDGKDPIFVCGLHVSEGMTQATRYISFDQKSNVQLLPITWRAIVIGETDD